MALIRAARTARIPLRHTFLVEETPTDSTTPVTVTVTDQAGMVISTGTATAADVGTYIYVAPPQQLLQVLTVAWSATIDTAEVVERDFAEIVGAHLFSITEARGSDSTLRDPAKYPAERIITARTEVETELELITDRAFTPHGARLVLDGTGTTDLALPHGDIRGVRAASVAARYGLLPVDLDAGELAALVVSDDQVLRRADGALWTAGLSNVVISYEYGLDTPPPDLVRAALTRLRWRLNIDKTGIPERAVSFSATDGGTYRLDLPDAYKTGMPDVDAVYSRYSRRDGAGTGTTGGRGVPASRSLNFDPQHGALFHGGIR